MSEPNTEYRSFSEDDVVDPGPSESSKAPRRGTRACDRCRKIKSKCEGTDGEKCRNCLAAGAACTFQGPSFKRGPPKGYIHAIEQRWHQVECILGTIMASPRAQSIVADLRQDSYARDVLERVDSGPYGPAGRAGQPAGTARDSAGFYNTIMNQSQQGSSYDDRRSKRQSRMTREFVSNQDSPIPAVPTMAWQDQLYRRLLAPSPGTGSPETPYSTMSDNTRFTSWSSSSDATSPTLAVPTSAPGLSGEPGRRRRRIDSAYHGSLHPDQTPTHMYKSQEPSDDGEYAEAVDALGHLSVDDNQEIRYHGKSAGLHLLARSGRTDDSEQNENGIWKFHMNRVDPGCHLSFERVNESVNLPDIATQDNLINLYFTYVHPCFPVVHKSGFLSAYYKRYNLHSAVETPQPAGQREPVQTVTKLLLLAMFAFAARYLPDTESSAASRSAWLLEAGFTYASDARRLFNTNYEDSRPSICQALLLLGLREYGIGSMAQGWLYTGMGCRMAIDLGMNRDADGWRDSRGNDLFSPVEKQTRKQIWWSCCQADKLSSVWLGRPVMYRKGDFNTPEPDVDMDEDEVHWHPYPHEALGPNFISMPAVVMSCFREQCKLSFLVSEIMPNIYPVKFSSDVPRRTHLDELESRLHNWMINLPENIRYHDTSKRPAPAPNVMVLHIEYYSSMLLLHRAFLPDFDDHLRFRIGHDHDPIALKSFDVCQSAASRISSMINAFDEVYGLKHAPPLLTIYLQGAGIMHVVTLNQRPRDTQATIGLLQCIHAAEQIADVWPTAIRIRNLLKGAKVQLDDLTALSQTADRPKRRVDEALGNERNSDLLQQSIYGLPTSSMPSTSYGSVPTQQTSYNAPYPSLMQPSMSTMPYVPGSEWWPQLIGPAAGQGFSAGYAYQPTAMGSHLSGLPQGLFTFDQDQLSSDFMQGVPESDGTMPHTHFPHSHTRQ